MTDKYCQKSDRDVAALTCGHPLPCPHHTVIIDATESPALVDNAEDQPRGVRRALQEIGDAAMITDEKKIRECADVTGVFDEYEADFIDGVFKWHITKGKPLTEAQRAKLDVIYQKACESDQ